MERIAVYSEQNGRNKFNVKVNDIVYSTFTVLALYYPIVSKSCEDRLSAMDGFTEGQLPAPHLLLHHLPVWGHDACIVVT